MSVVGGSHLKRPWDDKENHNLNSQRPRLSASVADESATRSPRAASPIAPQLSPISTTIEPALHLPHLSPPSSRGEPRQYTGFPSLYPPRTQGSAKRIRLYYDDMDPTISASLHRDPNSEDTHVRSISEPLRRPLVMLRILSIHLTSLTACSPGWRSYRRSRSASAILSYRE